MDHITTDISTYDIEKLRAVLSENPSQWEVRIALIEKLVRKGDIDAAKSLVRDAPESDPVPPALQKQLHSLLTPKPPPDRGLEKKEKRRGRHIVTEQKPSVLPAQKASTNPEKIRAVIGAVLLHLLLFLIFAWVAVDLPKRPRPHIVVTPDIRTEDPGEKSTDRMNRSRRATPPAPTGMKLDISIDSIASLQSLDVFASFDDTAFSDLLTGTPGYGIEAMTQPLSDISNLGMIPGTMRSRCSLEDRLERLRASGADERFEKAVTKGLNYITTQQDPTTGAFGERYPAAMTGLCLLCYLGHCETTESPEYGDNVAKAALYLMNRSLKGKGYISNGKPGSHEAYEHAIATYALSELHSMTKAGGKPIPRLESILKKAVQHIITYQSKFGGWAYRETNLDHLRREEDLSVSGWYIQALKAARLAGIEVPGIDHAFHLAIEEYLPSAQDSMGAFKYRLANPEGKEQLTGVGLLGMQLGGWYGSRRYQQGMAVLIDSNQRNRPSGDYYAPYYNTQVYYYHGEAAWYNHNNSFLSEMLEHQQADGSWPRQGAVYGKEEAQLMRTTLAILMLEVCYRYLPTSDMMSRIDF